MKKSKVTRSLLAACSIVALSAVMYGCVHSGSSSTPADPPPPPPPPADVDLMGSTDLSAGMTTISAGESLTVGDTTLSCAGDEDCVLTVMEDEVTGQLRATSTGGTVTVSVAQPPPPPTRHAVTLPEGHGLMAGTTELMAGDSVTVGRTTISCPEGDDGCTVTVSMDAVTGTLTATSTGGMAMVTVEPLPPAPMQYEVTLPDGHGLADGTTMPRSG